LGVGGERRVVPRYEAGHDLGVVGGGVRLCCGGLGGVG
jgi:hypothetical protein